MNEEHKKIIKANIGVLTDKTNVGALLPKLIEKGIFLENMVLKYQSRNMMDHNLKRDLYLTILTRGPTAFRNLISALNESGHGHLAILLEPGTPPVPNPKVRQRVHPFNLPEYLLEGPETLKSMQDYVESRPMCKINLRTEPINITVKKATKVIDSNSTYKTLIYAMGSNPKGYAMIINIKKYNDGTEKERVGAEHDERNLESLFKQLGYTVIIYRDLKGNKMLQVLEDFAQDKRHSHVDSCIVAILSHGEQVGDESHFVAADGEKVGVNTVLELFSNQNCSALQKKPKIFFFQCCRGDRYMHGIKEEFSRTKTDGMSDIPLRTYSDMLIAYSTVNGYQSHRDLYLGTWFIQAVCEVFMEHACDTEIMEMLKLVDMKLEPLVSELHTMQTTCFENRGFKTFFFNPGIYDSDQNDV